MNYKLIKYENLNLNQFIKLTNKKDRKVYEFNNTIYKIWSVNWEFKNMCEKGIVNKIINNQTVPNLIGIVKDKYGNNRGYSYKKFKNTQIFYKYTNNLHNPINYFLFKFKINFFLKINKIHLLKLLENLFNNFKKTNYIFIAINKESIWKDNKGYYLFDLDSFRKKEWLFEKNYNDKEYNRKKENLRQFNLKLSELLTIHKLKTPYFIDNEKKLDNFFKDLLILNKLH